MRSAKTLKASVTNWPMGEAGEPYKANIVIAGYQENSYEPLLLEALANHPGCKRLYYVPTNQANAFIVVGNPIKRRILQKKYAGHQIDDFDKEKHVLAYDITDLLKRHDGEPPSDAFAVEKKIEDYITSTESKPLSTRAINMYLSGHGSHIFDVFMPTHPNMFMMNGPASALVADNKGHLPLFSELVEERHGMKPTPLCAEVDDKASLEAFMDEHHLNKLVLKDPNTYSGGYGIYRVFREGPDKPIYMQDPKRDHVEESRETSVFGGKSGTVGEWKHIPEDAVIENESGLKVTVSLSQTMGGVAGKWTPMKDADSAMEITDKSWTKPMLAMEWMDTSKGDIRVVIQNGSIVGAYKRMAKAGSMLCNVAQGGTVHPVNLGPGGDFSPSDLERINAIAKTLRSYHINTASIDMLCDFEGKWKLSEINIGNTDDIIEIQSHNRERDLAAGNLLTADAMAADIMQEYREKVETVAAEKAAFLESMRSGHHIDV